MNSKRPLYLCMGSACHQLGGFRLLPELKSLIERHNLEAEIELKGAFCLENCMRGLSLKFEGRVLTGFTSDNLESRFIEEILSSFRHG